MTERCKKLIIAAVAFVLGAAVGGTSVYINSWVDGYTTNNGAKSGSTSFAEESAASDDYSETNVQVEGVDEADTVKTDGKFIYILKSNYDESEKIIKTEIKTVDIRNGEPTQLKRPTICI